MTDPQPTTPPEDPDANLTDEEKVQKGRVKRWVAEAFKETITELRSEDPPDPPKRTQPEKTSNKSIINSLFGG